MGSTLLTAYQGKTALVTGGAGAVGGNLVEALCTQGCAKVIVLDDLSASSQWLISKRDPVRFVEGSVTNEAALKQVFLERPDFVFHLAAFFANQNSVEHPETDLQVNGLGTLRVLEYAQMVGVERLVYASSGASFYDEFAPLPLSEDYMTLHHTTPYKATKMLGEVYCNFFHHHYGLPVVKTRFFNSYGPGEVPGRYSNVIPNFIDRAMRGSPLVITGYGNETGDFAFVEDLVEGILRAGVAEGVEPESFNLASGRETRILELAEMINGMTGNSAGIEFVERRQWDTQTRRWASITKAQNLLGYKPRTALEEGLRVTIRWFEEQWDWINGQAPDRLPAFRAIPVEAQEIAAQPILVSVGPKEQNGQNGHK